MDDTTQKLQALLYSNGGEMKKETLLKVMGITHDSLDSSIKSLIHSMEGQGIVVMHTETTISMQTSPKFQEYITATQKTNTKDEIGTAALEVLSIVLYNDGASRSEIDYIRGVNSSTTLRLLVIRGLLEKTIQEENRQLARYIATPELLSYVGVTSPVELPRYTQENEELSAHLYKDTATHE